MSWPYPRRATYCIEIYLFNKNSIYAQQRRDRYKIKVSISTIKWVWLNERGRSYAGLIFVSARQDSREEKRKRWRPIFSVLNICQSLLENVHTFTPRFQYSSKSVQVSYALPMLHIPLYIPWFASPLSSGEILSPPWHLNLREPRHNSITGFQQRVSRRVALIPKVTNLFFAIQGNSSLWHERRYQWREISSRVSLYDVVHKEDAIWRIVFDIAVRNSFKENGWKCLFALGLEFLFYGLSSISMQHRYFLLDLTTGRSRLIRVY